MTNREIDALVAEKIMGYKLKREDCNSFWVDEDGDEPNHSHKYSTDIAAAWEVLDKIQYGKFYSISNDDIYKKYRMEMKIGMGKENEFVITGNSLPMVICLAALRFFGVHCE